MKRLMYCETKITPGLQKSMNKNMKKKINNKSKCYEIFATLKSQRYADS